MAESVIIYGKPACPHCFNAKRDFQARGIAYVEYNVQADKEKLEEMLRLNGGLRRVPTIVEGDRVTVGFKGGF